MIAVGGCSNEMGEEMAVCQRFTMEKREEEMVAWLLVRLKLMAVHVLGFGKVLSFPFI